MQIEKYLNMCEFLEVNLEKFHELLTIKEEFEQKRGVPFVRRGLKK